MHEFVSQEIINKDSIPRADDYKPEESALLKEIRDLAFDKAIKYKCKCFADAKGLRTDCHQAAARLRRMGTAISLGTQIEEKPLTTAQQNKYDATPHKGIFRRLCYLYIWKEPVR
jgi:hypothetical protein